MVQKVSRTIVIYEGKLLLLKNKYSDGIYYGFPGGWQEEGEDEERCAIRETKEETNLRVKIIKKIYQHEFINNKKHLLTTYFLARPTMAPYSLSVDNDPDKLDKKPQEALWMPIKKITDLPMRPKEFIDTLLQDYETHFPAFRVIPTTRV